MALNATLQLHHKCYALCPVRLPRNLPAQPSYAGRGEEEPYAVVEVAGHQIVAQPNRLYTVAHLRVAPGTELRLPRVLLLRRETEVLTGRPYVWGRWVGVRVVEHVDGPEIMVTKFKRKKHYLRRKVHVQRYTRILVTDIEGEGELEEEGAGDLSGADQDGAEDRTAGGGPPGPPVPRLPPLVFPVLPTEELDRRLSVAKAWLDGKPLLPMTQAAMKKLREEHEAEAAA
ncbi:hypothetical protein H632_c728p1 [Helicosporidium sp. ATCC 50920]|nr:hypothetical protein H632_c728p1 [Helicosporidium sp. ATCC 50920]|eukprot:KDD75351.1 hypothetical protein H632_c728p1 [Helicosporidium sp. ATCC 50920]